MLVLVNIAVPVFSLAVRHVSNVSAGLSSPVLTQLNFPSSVSLPSEIPALSPRVSFSELFVFKCGGRDSVGRAVDGRHCEGFGAAGWRGRGVS